MHVEREREREGGGCVWGGKILLQMSDNDR